MQVKPRDDAADTVALVLRVDEHVAFVFLDHSLRFNTESFQGVPEFVRLRSGAFAVAVADDYQSWSFHVLDEGDRRALRRSISKSACRVTFHPGVTRRNDRPTCTPLEVSTRRMPVVVGGLPA
jgi:hypothetical protein